MGSLEMVLMSLYFLRFTKQRVKIFLRLLEVGCSYVVHTSLRTHYEWISVTINGSFVVKPGGWFINREKKFPILLVNLMDSSVCPKA